MNKPIALNQIEQRSRADSALRSAQEPPRALYIHVPFCFHKCHYCDFYSFVDSQDRQGPYADALILELKTLARAFKDDRPKPLLDSIFVGGGTPTLLRAEHWERVLESLHSNFDVSRDTEFTVESNPETTTPDVLRVLVDGGVNRISIGAQSFNPAHLQTLERHHNPENVPRALELAASLGIARRSIDLIFAIPGQTLDDLANDLDRALALGDLLEHLSVYNLMYEPNTALTKRLEQGRVRVAGESLEIEMFELVNDTLARAGFASYEISNYAKPGAECRHNMAYWLQHQWLAAGPSASAHVAGQRWKNVPRLTSWMDSVTANDGFCDVTDLEAPDNERALAERLMTGIRLTQGFDASAVLADAARLGKRSAIERAAVSLVEDGIITIDGNTYTLTRDGMLLADEASARFIDAVMSEVE